VGGAASDIAGSGVAGGAWAAVPRCIAAGSKWRALPADFLPWRTVYGCFARWKICPRVDNLVDELRRRVRISDGRDLKPTAGCIDSQSVKRDRQPRLRRRQEVQRPETAHRRGHLGLLIAIVVTTASVQDRTLDRDRHPPHVGRWRLRRRRDTVLVTRVGGSLALSRSSTLRFAQCADCADTSDPPPGECSSLRESGLFECPDNVDRGPVSRSGPQPTRSQAKKWPVGQKARLSVRNC
jgi:hypothetical protein